MNPAGVLCTLPDASGAIDQFPGSKPFESAKSAEGTVFESSERLLTPDTCGRNIVKQNTVSHRAKSYIGIETKGFSIHLYGRQRNALCRNLRAEARHWNTWPSSLRILDEIDSREEDSMEMEHPPPIQLV